MHVTFRSVFDLRENQITRGKSTNYPVMKSRIIFSHPFHFQDRLLSFVILEKREDQSWQKRTENQMEKTNY